MPGQGQNSQFLLCNILLHSTMLHIYPVLKISLSLPLDIVAVRQLIIKMRKAYFALNCVFLSQWSEVGHEQPS